MDKILGVDLYIHTDDWNRIDANVTDAILMEYKDSIKDFAYITSLLDRYQNDKAFMKASDLANINDLGIKLQSIQTSQILDNSMTFEYSDTDSDLTPTEQLYTARGYQSVGTTTTIADEFIPSFKNYTDTMLI